MYLVVTVEHCPTNLAAGLDLARHSSQRIAVYVLASSIVKSGAEQVSWHRIGVM